MRLKCGRKKRQKTHLKLMYISTKQIAWCDLFLTTQGPAIRRGLGRFTAAEAAARLFRVNSVQQAGLAPVNLLGG